MRHVRWITLWLVASGCGGTSFSADFDAGSEGGSEAAPTPEASGPEAAGGDAAHDASVVDSSLADAGGGDAPSPADGGADAAPEGASSEGGSEGGADAASDGTWLDAMDAGGATDSGEACAPVVYYLDGDGDGYGGTTTVLACAPPDAGAWITKGGDCDDSNPVVSPGQTSFFAQGYVPTGKSEVSFDYDCDGHETESGSSPKANCQEVGLSCVGSGYLEATPVRSGSGVDAFCGSTSEVTCAVVSLVCKAGTPYDASPITCR